MFSFYTSSNLLPRIFNEVLFVVAYDGIVVAHLSYSEVPNLKALAEVMNAEYSRDENGMIIKVTMGQISNYFDAVEGDKGENARRTCSM